MSTLKFAETHNLVAFLEKPEESSGFEEIIDFLNASYVQYALTVNPTIYTACFEQFWAYAKDKIVNGERQIQALVDKKKVIITETSIRSDLKLDDAKGIDCLPTASIFVELERMGEPFENWRTPNSSSLNHSDDRRKQHLEGGVKFLMYPRFMQVFLDKQVEGMTRHKGVYVTPSYTKKVFANMKRPCKGFSGRVTSLFSTMMVQAIEDMEPVTDEAHVSTPSYDLPQSGDDSMQLSELMNLCTSLQEKVLDLEKSKTAQAKEITSLKKRVKQLEKRKKSRPSGLRSYDEISKLFDKEMKRLNTFVDMNSKVVKGSETRTEESSKRARDELESDKLKKHKIDEHVEAKKYDDPKEEDMKKHMEIVQDEEEIAIEAIPLATKPLMIVEYKIVKEGQKGFYHLIRADGSYSQNSKAYIILNKHTKKIEESLNVTFDETPPPSKTSPLVDDDLDEEEAIRATEKKNLKNVVEDETLEIDKIVNIKESRNHPLENVIGNLNQRTLRSQAQNQSNFFCFISTIEPKNVNEVLGDESWIVAMQEELNQFIANDIWEEGQVRRIRHEEEIDVLEYQVLTREIEPTLKHLEEIIRENVFCLGRIEWVTRQKRLILPYGMLLTYLFKVIMNENPELNNESYVLYDRVMNPLAAQQERKPRKYRGTRRGRHSTSSSSAFDQPYSSHLNDDDDDDGYDKGTSRASTPSPIHYVNSLTNQVPQVF
ncbi:hypothetical protein Tco_1113962 [Tanacetum coccineum]|uniref:Retroviral polymerase SH3-like domain-containing protein n=1 Tax=Tanacetum coccineum TaxID=301880 RepID=A0ABQ5ITT0_9ASTR